MALTMHFRLRFYCNTITKIVQTLYIFGLACDRDYSYKRNVFFFQLQLLSNYYMSKYSKRYTCDSSSHRLVKSLHVLKMALFRPLSFTRICPLENAGDCIVHQNMLPCQSFFYVRLLEMLRTNSCAVSYLQKSKTNM